MGMYEKSIIKQRKIEHILFILLYSPFVIKVLLTLLLSLFFGSARIYILMTRAGFLLRGDKINAGPLNY